MNSKQPQPTDAAARRQRAEARLQQQNPASGTGRTAADTQRLVHELEVHQIELEMQNEELQKTRDELEAALEKYSDLYEFAPTGYLNLARDGTILAVNLTGACLLGIERGQLVNRRFALLVAEAERPAFKGFLQRTFVGKERACCDVALLRFPSAESAPRFVRLDAVVSEDRQECRVTMLDVTDRHQAEAEGARSLQELQMALALVKSLSGLLPICPHCKNIRDDPGYWHQVEAYMQQHSEANFSHGLCPACLQKHFPAEQRNCLNSESGVSLHAEPLSTACP